MQGRPLLGIGLSLLLATGIWAAGPDEEYVRIYRKIVEADSLRENGQYGPARQLYQNAQESLETLQRANPAWNERLVIYRLNYIANQLKVTSGTPPPPPSAQPPTPGNSAPAVQTVQPDPALLQIQQENQALRATAARLEAKLKEALSVQPAPLDPKELAKAQEQLRELAKENEVLKANLEEGQKKMRSILVTNSVTKVVTNTVEKVVTNTLVNVVTNKVAIEPPDVGDLRKNLTNQINAITALRAENEVLKKELSTAKSTPPPAPTPAPAPAPNPNPEIERKLQESLKELAAVQAANQALVKKQAEIEKTFNEARQAQSSQEEKLKRLESLEKELAQSRTDSQKLTEQNEALQKRLTDTVSSKSLDMDSSRRILKLEKDLLESQSEVRLLSRQKGDLQQKLASAQSVKSTGPEGGAPLQITPGAGGEAASVEVHRQLKQATWEVLNLQAQNQDLLKKQSALEQQLVKSSGSKASYDSIDQDRLQRLEKMNLELVDARKSAARLEQENQEMARQLAMAKLAATATATTTAPTKSPASEENTRKMQEAQAQLRQAEEANRELQRKAARLEQQLAEAKSALTIPPPSAANPKRSERIEQELAEAKESAKKLQQENRDLEKKLALAESGSSGRRNSSKSASNSGGSRNLERELAMLKSRLDAIQAKAVPYTEEELSLFSRLEVNIASGNSPSANGSNRSGTSSTAVATEIPPAAAAQISDARKDFDSGKFADAERKFQESLKADERNVYLLAHLAAAQFEQEKFADADRTVQRALAVSPDDAPSLYMLGIIRLRQDKVDEAVDALSRAAQASPQNAITQNSLGVALSQKGLREPAETAFRKALQIRPDYADAHYNLAVEYILQQPPSYKLAQWHYQKAIAGGHVKNAELEKRLEAAAASATKPAGQ